MAILRFPFPRMVPRRRDSFRLRRILKPGKERRPELHRRRTNRLASAIKAANKPTVAGVKCSIQPARREPSMDEYPTNGFDRCEAEYFADAARNSLPINPPIGNW